MQYIPTRAYFITVKRERLPNFDPDAFFTFIAHILPLNVEESEWSYEVGPKLQTLHWHLLVVLDEFLNVPKSEWKEYLGYENDEPLSVIAHNPNKESTERFISCVKPYVMKNNPVY